MSDHDDTDTSGIRNDRYRSRRPAVTMQPTALAVLGNSVNSSTTSTELSPATHGHIPNRVPIAANASPISICVERGVPVVPPRM